MLIRKATLLDLPRISELASRSLVDGPYAGIIEDKPAQARKCAEAVMQNGTILLGEENGEVVGVLGFIRADHHFSGQPYAAELMWYVLPEHRAGGLGLKLLWEAERLAKAAGAKSMAFTAPNDATAALYERFGYHKLEVTYQKDLTCHS
jgi:GNAT superfamily N-acetyltransferase